MAVKSPKETTVAFIVCVWIEHSERKYEEPVWRGVIEHVGSGDRFYFEQLEQTALNVTPYIDAMGVKVDKPKS